jgi:regulator of protease activity HflC (stomatin/prohibitin superfamily)
MMAMRNRFGQSRPSPRVYLFTRLMSILQEVKGKVEMKQMTPVVSTVIAILLVVVGGFGTFYQIDEGERGVILRNGSIIGVAEPGLGMKIPVITSIVGLSVRDHTYRFDKLEAYSFDQQPATLQVSVTYRPAIGEITKVYAEYGSLEQMQSRILERRTLEAVKNVFGKYTATKAIQEREKLATDVKEAMRNVMADVPVQIVGTQIEEIEFSKAYEQSIEQRMLAQVQIETTQQKQKTAEIEAQTRVINAKAEADAQRAAFEAQADGIRLRGQAEAQAIEARAKALAQNVNLVQLIAVEKWDGKLPTTQVPGSALPFIGIK